MTMSSNSLDVDVAFDPVFAFDDPIRAGKTLLSTFFPFARYRNELSSVSRRLLEDDASAFAGDPWRSGVEVVVKRRELASASGVTQEGTIGTANPA